MTHKADDNTSQKQGWLEDASRVRALDTAELEDGQDATSNTRS